MDRSEKVEFTMEGYRKVLDSLVIEGEKSGSVMTANNAATVTGESAGLREALLAEVVANFVL